MKQAKWACAVLMAGALLAGCDNSDTTKPATPSTPPAPSTPAAPQAGPAATPGVPAAPAVPPAVSEAGTAASDAATALTAEAESKLKQVVEYIKTNKLDAAEKLLVQLEEMKPKLTPELVKGIDSARTMLNSAKAAGGAGVNIPGMGH